MDSTSMRQILIVDDERLFRVSLKQSLEKEGKYEIHLAENGEIALQLARDHSFDLLIADLEMGGIDGFSLIARLKQTLPDIKVIVISARKSSVTISEAEELGVSAFLDKPVDMYTVRDIVNNVFRKDSRTSQV